METVLNAPNEFTVSEYLSEFVNEHLVGCVTAQELDVYISSFSCPTSLPLLTYHRISPTLAGYPVHATLTSQKRKRK
tara:strand:- start:3690 stop:3920 length:231 start_codon:yes stop_codon:yes gene_type:complete